MYKYTYGEGDGSFICEYDSSCHNSTWDIYADKNYKDSRRPLLVGQALCGEHAPKDLKQRHYVLESEE